MLTLTLCYALDILKGQDTNSFFILNHFLEDIFPSYDDAQIINERSALEDRTTSCADANGSNINLLAVDFWSAGEVAEFVFEYNKAL